MVLCVVDVDLSAPRRDGEQGPILGVFHVRYPRLSATHLATKKKTETFVTSVFVHGGDVIDPPSMIYALQGQLHT